MESTEEKPETNVNKTESVSDSEESSDKDSPVRVSHSDAEDNMVLVTKVGDKVNDEETTDDNVHEIKVLGTTDNSSVGISEQNGVSNSNGQQSGAEVKEDDEVSKQENSIDSNVPSAAHYEKVPSDPKVI